jgi:hypothetical protein
MEWERAVMGSTQSAKAMYKDRFGKGFERGI